MLEMAIPIPVKTYIKTWLENRYGINHEKFGRVIHFTKKTWEGKYFFSLSNSEKHRWDKRVFSQFPSQVVILVSYDYYTRYRVHPNPTMIIEFNAFAEDMIKEYMTTYVEAKVEEGIAQAKAIRRYQDKYGFTEDDFSTDSIKKHIQRNTTIKKERNTLKMRA
jgi:hypothetical protein